VPPHTRVAAGRLTPGAAHTEPVTTSQAASARPPGNRLLHVLDRLAGRPVVAVAVVVADLVWVLYSGLVGFPTRLETVFQTLVAALTLAMVFIIQHTQSRPQVATQRKLDEIDPAGDPARRQLPDRAGRRRRPHLATTHRDLRREALGGTGSHPT